MFHGENYHIQFFGVDAYRMRSCALASPWRFKSPQYVVNFCADGTRRLGCLASNCCRGCLYRVFAWEKIGLQFSSGLEILGSGEFTTIHRKPTRSPKEVDNIRLRAMFPSRFLGQSVASHPHVFRSWRFGGCGFLPRW